jgi:hypothetical protein
VSLRLARCLLPAALGGLFFPAFSACSEDTLKLCGEIPQDGCPIGRGGTCADVVCGALYDCIDGLWTQVKRCPAPAGDGGPGSDGGGGGLDAACTPVMINHQDETAGCTPDLQDPDCPAAAAETCAAAACLTGCIDFFLCTKDGWREAAYCDDQGDLVVVPP